MVWTIPTWVVFGIALPTVLMIVVESYVSIMHHISEQYIDYDHLNISQCSHNRLRLKCHLHHKSQETKNKKRHNTINSQYIDSINVDTYNISHHWEYIDNHYPLLNSHNYGNSLFSRGKFTISMAIFNSFVTNYQGDPEGKSHKIPFNHHFPMACLWFSIAM